MELCVLSSFSRLFMLIRTRSKYWLILQSPCGMSGDGETPTGLALNSSSKHIHINSKMFIVGLAIKRRLTTVAVLYRDVPESESRRAGARGGSFLPLITTPEIAFDYDTDITQPHPRPIPPCEIGTCNFKIYVSTLQLCKNTPAP